MAAAIAVSPVRELAKRDVAVVEVAPVGEGLLLLRLPLLLLGQPDSLLDRNQPRLPLAGTTSSPVALQPLWARRLRLLVEVPAFSPVAAVFVSPGAALHLPATSARREPEQLRQPAVPTAQLEW